MGVPTRIRMQHEQNKLRSKIRTAEKRKIIKNTTEIENVKIILSKKNKTLLKNFEKLIQNEKNIKLKIQNLINKYSKKSNKKSSKKSSKK